MNTNIDKTPVCYTFDQIERLESYIESRFGAGRDAIIHEIESEYVHSDVFIADSSNGEPTFVTMGMSARETDAPLDEFRRTELVMLASPALQPISNKGRVLAAELVHLTKFPFANNQWFGPGHTINATENFRKTFGFDAFLFVYGEDVMTLGGVGDIAFLVALPIYQSEREHIMENGHADFLQTLFANHKQAAFYADSGRESVDEVESLTVRDLLDVDDELLEELRAYAEEYGTLTEDDIRRILEERGME